jgi:hypothetical protein
LELSSNERHAVCHGVGDSPGKLGRIGGPNGHLPAASKNELGISKLAHMTNPQNSPSEAKIDAELRDKDAQLVSTGAAIFRRDEMEALFYPRDLAPAETIQSWTRILFLIQLNESFRVDNIQYCQEETPHELHFHLKLS